MSDEEMPKKPNVKMDVPTRRNLGELAKIWGKNMQDYIAELLDVELRKEQLMTRLMPDLSYEGNTNLPSLSIKDAKLKDIANVKFEGTTLVCSICGKEPCQHKEYAKMLPYFGYLRKAN